MRDNLKLLLVMVGAMAALLGLAVESEPKAEPRPSLEHPADEVLTPTPDPISTPRPAAPREAETPAEPVEARPPADGPPPLTWEEFAAFQEWLRQRGQGGGDPTPEDMPPAAAAPPAEPEPQAGDVLPPMPEDVPPAAPREPMRQPRAAAAPRDGPVSELVVFGSEDCPPCVRMHRRALDPVPLERVRFLDVDDPAHQPEIVRLWAGARADVIGPDGLPNVLPAYVRLEDGLPVDWAGGELPTREEMARFRDGR